jgi:hypothetical protein
MVCLSLVLKNIGQVCVRIVKIVATVKEAQMIMYSTALFVDSD